MALQSGGSSSNSSNRRPVIKSNGSSAKTSPSMSPMKAKPMAPPITASAGASIERGYDENGMLKPRPLRLSPSSLLPPPPPPNPLLMHLPSSATAPASSTAAGSPPYLPSLQEQLQHQLLHPQQPMLSIPARSRTTSGLSDNTDPGAASNAFPPSLLEAYLNDNRIPISSIPSTTVPTLPSPVLSSHLPPPLSTLRAPLASTPSSSYAGLHRPTSSTPLLSPSAPVSITVLSTPPPTEPMAFTAALTKIPSPPSSRLRFFAGSDLLSSSSSPTSHAPPPPPAPASSGSEIGSLHQPLKHQQQQQPSHRRSKTEDEVDRLMKSVWSECDGDERISGSRASATPSNAVTRYSSRQQQPRPSMLQVELSLMSPPPPPPSLSPSMISPFGINKV